MFRNVIVGVDGSQGGQDAIALARLLREDGELTFAYVYPGDNHTWRGSNSDYDAEERNRSRAILVDACERSGIKATLRARGASSVGRGLHELAESAEADLLVLGSSRRSLLGRVLIGDDTRAALNGAPCAVAIAPAGYASDPQVMREVGVGYNASPESEHALGVARALASRYHTKLSAFEAVTYPSHALTEMPVDDAYSIQALVDAARERVARLERVEPHAAYGTAAEELALYSASLDLLVIGSRSYGPLGRLVHGSTAQQLARVARCPLLVLTRASRQAEKSAPSLDGQAAATGSPM